WLRWCRHELLQRLELDRRAHDGDHQHVIGRAHRRIIKRDSHDGIRTNFLATVPQFIQRRFARANSFFLITGGTPTGKGTKRLPDVFEEVNTSDWFTRDDADVGVNLAAFNIVGGSKNHGPQHTAPRSELALGARTDF